MGYGNEINELLKKCAIVILSRDDAPAAPAPTATTARTHEPAAASAGLDDFAHGLTVLVRTYEGGIWFGELVKKKKNEVVLENARLIWKCACKKSVGWPGVAVCGIDQEKSKVSPPVSLVWLRAIGIIPTWGSAAESIMNAPIGCHE